MGRVQQGGFNCLVYLNGSAGEDSQTVAGFAGKDVLLVTVSMPVVTVVQAYGPVVDNILDFWQADLLPRPTRF